MHRILCLALLSSLCLSLASALECNVCGLHLKPLADCIFKSKKINCSEACGTMTYQISSDELKWAIKEVKRLDCVKNDTCGTATLDSSLGYQYNTTCCYEDACNTGSSVLAKASLIAGTATLSIWLFQLL